MPTQAQWVELTYTLRFAAPFHCGTGLPRGLIDRTVRRGADGLLIIPGSTIKGALRERCEHLARLLGKDLWGPHDEQQALRDYDVRDRTLLSRVFGTRVEPGTLFFDDAILSQEWRDLFTEPKGSLTLRERYRAGQAEMRTQVSMSRRTGTARPGLLFTSEYGLRGMAFEGKIYGRLEDWPLSALADGAQGSFALVLLVASVYALDRLGGNRSVGVGELACTITKLAVDARTIDAAAILKHLDLEYFDLYDLVKGEG